jgi:molecular chaperone GrpE
VLDFRRSKHDIPASKSLNLIRRDFSKRQSMTDPNRPNDDPANAAQAGEPVVSKPYVMPDDPEPGSVEAMSKEVAEARDKMLRTLAEMENLRQRTRREVADAKTYGITGFARDVLEIADNLQRALDAVPAEAKAAADPGLKALIEGVELTERSLLNALEKNGVKKFDPSGERFDPNFQQAMYEVPDPRGHRGAGSAGRLHDRRSRAASGAGRRRQGRREAGACGGQRQRAEQRRVSLASLRPARAGRSEFNEHRVLF